MQAYLLNRVCDVRPCYCEILECSRHAAVQGAILDQYTVIAGELRIRVSRCGHGLAICHPWSLEEVDGVRGLGELKPHCCSLDVNTQEVTDRPHVLQCKGRAKIGDDVLQQGHARRGEDHVIDIVQEIRHVVALPEDKEGGVCSGLLES